MLAAVKQSRLNLAHGRAIAAWAVVASLVVWSITSMPAVAQERVHVGEVRETIGDGGAKTYELIRESLGSDGEEKSQIQAWREDNPLLRDRGGFPARADLEEDLLQVQKLMQNPTLALQALADLEVAVRKLIDEQKLEPAQALEQALSTLEVRHYFPGARIVALGILPDKEFVELPAQGYVLTDVGAGLFHGEQAHRLQWAMIISEFEKAPLEWNHTPFELFARIGEWDRMVGTWGRNVWGHLFDQAGVDSMETMGDVNSAEINRKFRTEGGVENLVRPDGFRHPDRLTIHMAKNDASVSHIPSIAAGVRQRYEQREMIYRRYLKDNDLGDLEDYDLDASERANEAVAAELRTQLLTNGYVEWKGENSNLLIHQDDRAAADGENEETKKIRIRLARRDWNMGTEPFESAGMLQKATDIRFQRVSLMHRPNPTATPLPTRPRAGSDPPPKPSDVADADSTTASPPKPGDTSDSPPGSNGKTGDDGRRPKPRRSTH